MRFISRQNSGQEILKHAVLQSKTWFILRWVYSKIFLIINCYVYQNASWQAVSLFIHSSKLRLPLRSTCWGIPQSLETHLSMRPRFGICYSSFRNVLVISCASWNFFISDLTSLYSRYHSFFCSNTFVYSSVSSLHHIHFLFWNDSRIIKTFGFCKDGVLFFCLNTK